MPNIIIITNGGGGGGGGGGGNSKISNTDGIIIGSILGGCALIIFLVICIYKIYNKYCKKNYENTNRTRNRDIIKRNTENDNTRENTDKIIKQNTENDNNREKLGLKPIFDYTQNNSIDNKVFIPKETIV